MPFSVRLQGRVQISGCGEVVLGEGVSLNGTVVPIELVTYTSGLIEIGNHTFINYGSSIAARASVKIGSHCHLGHYTIRDGQRPARCRQAYGIAAVRSGYHRRPCLDRLKGDCPSRRPHRHPRRNWCGQHRHQGHPSAMCGSGESCACASSPHGARMSAGVRRHTLGLTGFTSNRNQAAERVGSARSRSTAVACRVCTRGSHQRAWQVCR